LSSGETEAEEISRLARKFAYINAIEHDGRASEGSVTGSILAENAELRKRAKLVKSVVAEGVARVNRLSVEEQRAALEAEFPGVLEKRVARKREVSKLDSERSPTLPDLPDAEMGKVVTRFPPEPNGFMHIGHAKAALIGYEYARRYQGKFILRFDDTNPAAEKKEYYGAFRESLEWLGIHPDLVRNSSDDMTKFYDLARKMIETGEAYVCTCSQETMRENRASGKPCVHRSNDADLNLTLWDDMISGRTGKKDATLRFVGDMQSLNTTMRDPVLFRIVEEPHPLKGDAFRVWPTYDFDGAVEDSLDGVTHAMRSKEYELRDELYFAVLRSLDLRQPKMIEFSRLSLKDTTVSKRSLKKLIEQGLVSGWDDPRLPTISGLRRRGFLPEAIREFILGMGLSKVESEPTWDLLESINRKLLDPVARRYFFVEGPVPLVVENAPPVEVSMKLHPQNDYGERKVKTEGKFLISGSDARRMDPGSKVRLIEAYNVEITSGDSDGLRAKYEGREVLENALKVQWVTPEFSSDFEVAVTGQLLINDEYNPNSLRIAKGRIEADADRLSVGEIIQLVRFGFCRLDSPGKAIMAHK
jgi:glutamyl-tRNA synthetase